MVKNFRRGARGVTQLDLDRMTLIGPDRKAVLTERKSFLVVDGDDIVKLFAREFNPVPARRLNYLLDPRPAGFVEIETDLFGPMSQHQAEKLAYPDFAIVHACLTVPRA